MPPASDKNENHPLTTDDMTALILVGLLSGFILLSALVWCICCGTCFGRELWAQYARRARRNSYASDEDEHGSNEELLRQENRTRYANSFDEFILEETELGLLTRRV
ncbi:hypothetical protein BDF19DRAFT_465467 [Syncephalis fuscata]|nr:hypothetical protein BDF19DRAFT_465467 [Syncephalis fuscata]